MIGYTLLVLVATVTVILGSIVVGVAVWGWGQQKKALKKAEESTGNG